MIKKIDFELKVGIFVFIGLIIIVIIIFSISDFRAMSAGYYLKVAFNFANGIESGAPVRLSGVKVGEIKAIQIIYPEQESKPTVQLLIWLDNKAKVHADAVPYINNLGLLGEKYLEISPGSKDSPILEEGEILQGKDSVSMAQVTELGYQIAYKLNNIIASVDDIFSDSDVKVSLKKTLKNSQKLTQEFGNLSASAAEILDRMKRGEGTIGKLLSDEELYDDIDDFVKDLKAHPWKLLYRPRGAK